MSEVKKFITHFPKSRLVRKHRPGRCPLFGCRQPSRSKGVLCGRHSLRLWRMTNPLGAYFAQIRDRARERGQVFTLTLEQFREIVADTGYMEGRGRSAHCLHLDRIDASRGYEPGNVRVVTARENCVKSAQEKRREYVQHRIGAVEDDPF
jgi:hypothetical protein